MDTAATVISALALAIVVTSLIIGVHVFINHDHPDMVIDEPMDDMNEMDVEDEEKEHDHAQHHKHKDKQHKHGDKHE